ncbi:MAG: HD domain-containing phosphohydrolase [Trueperaceae bacterium]|nr:HD domain-containing phosphohydrolase [Trueperaceae bacterium]
MRLSEVVAALTYALDVTEGQPEGHAVRNCAIGMAVGRRLGLDEVALSALYYALLLKDLGCSSNASRLTATFGADDQRVKRAFKFTDLDSLVDGARFVLGQAGRAALRRGGVRAWFRHVRVVASGEGGGHRSLTEIRCERGADIARELGFPAATSEAIRALDEHWDGGGHPYGLAREAIPMLGRILCLSQTVEVFHAARGPAAARTVARRRAGRWFDPDVVEAFLAAQAARGFWDRIASKEVESHVTDLEPAEHVLRADEARLDRIAEAFARVIDAKSPWTYRHSERVRAFAAGIAGEVGLPPERRTVLHRAALLHDLGKLAVPNTILDKPGKLTDDEFATIRRHPALSERIVRRVVPFDQVAAIAGAHHERIDGRGYHQGRPANALPLEARILATADAFEAMTASRPYRDGMPVERALGILRDDAGAGVEAACLDALERFLAADEGRRLTSASEPDGPVSNGPGPSTP